MAFLEHPVHDFIMILFLISNNIFFLARSSLIRICYQQCLPDSFNHIGASDITKITGIQFYAGCSLYYSGKLDLLVCLSNAEIFTAECFWCLQIIFSTKAFRSWSNWNSRAFKPANLCQLLQYIFAKKLDG